jgi:formate dehydrogenase subunit gamma
MSTVPIDPTDVAPTDEVHRGDPVVVDRYTTAARINHWITAACLILLAISGLALFHPSLFFLTALFGGGQITRAIHPWIGVVLFFSFAGLFLRFWHLNLWKGADTTWLVRLRKVLANRDHEDPDLVEIGKYNAGQKIVFWGMSFLIIVLIASGLVIWDQYFAQYTDITQKRVAVLIHAIAAVTIICVWIVHVYAAIWVRGTISAMTRGQVTGGWAWRHHRKWLKELVTGKSPG